MASSVKVLFWLYKSRKNSKNEMPLMLRLSYDRKRVDKSTGYFVSSANWNVVKQKVKGHDQVSVEINNWINSVKAKVIMISRQEEEVHLPTILNKLFAKAHEEPTLLQVFREHNAKMKERIGNGYRFSTYEKYVFALDKIEAFMKQKLKVDDMYLKDLKVDFIIDFDHYLRVHDHNQHNTAVKYCLNLKKVINEAVLKGIMRDNPFQSYKTVYKDTPQVYLQYDEVVFLENFDLKKGNHILVRDLFLFQCYTGLAYTDLTTLSKKDFSVDEKGRMWIIKQRQKTGIVSYIPLLPRAKEILERYQNNLQQKNGLFPFYSIQKYNQYLGEIGDLAGFDKKLSSHVGRRTFGNIALAKGISINVISKILGHSNTMITQRIYAITTQRIVGNEIDKW